MAAPNPATLKARARRAFGRAAEDFSTDQSADSYSRLNLAMLALQQSGRRNGMAERCLAQMKVPWRHRKNAEDIIAEEVP